MTVEYTITKKCLTLDIAQARSELQEFKETARDFDVVESWIVKHLPLFGGIALQAGDKVSLEIKPDMVELSRLQNTDLLCSCDIEIERKAKASADLSGLLDTAHNDNIVELKHRFTVFMPLQEWPLVIAKLVADYRKRYNFQGAPEILDTNRKFMDPFLLQHFPKLSFDTLCNLASVDLLPNNHDGFISFMFATRDNRMAQNLPEGVDLNTDLVP